MNDRLARRVADLAARVERLELRAIPAAPATPDQLGEAPATGLIHYSGEVDLAGPVTWSISYDATDVLALDRDRVAAVLAALGHPARLAIVATLLLSGRASSAELQEAVAEGSSGQLYHHLRSLTSAGVITKGGRNHYRIAAPGVVPVLVLMLAGGDLGGALGASISPSREPTDPAPEWDDTDK